jgi:hypothetical protein
MRDDDVLKPVEQVLLWLQSEGHAVMCGFHLSTAAIACPLICLAMASIIYVLVTSCFKLIAC